MQDPADQVTADLIPTPKKRGRPATGKAMTTAQRKRAQRERDQMNVWRSSTDYTSVTVTGLLEQLAKAVSEGYPGTTSEIANELINRAKKNAER